MAEPELSPKVVIAEDKMTAQLVVPAGYDSALLTEPMLLGLIRGEGVEPTDTTSQALNKLIEGGSDSEHDQTIQIAVGQPPVHGKDGLIRWHIEDDSDEQPQPNSQEKVSYYDRSSFVLVHTGQTLGKVQTAEPGQDGRDVTGASIAARSGKDATLQTDETIMRRADGSLVAQMDGVLYREPGKASIRKFIEIKEYVDFSTGNIDFDGDVAIARGVRDCFLVKATGNVEVHGLIEAATIETGKDLRALGGFAGRERGHVRIGGTLHAKYLDNVHGHVKQDLCIDREIINCQISIEGEIRSPRGSIIGGVITPTGAVEIGTVGSGAGVVTELVIGSIPALEPFAVELERIVGTLTVERDKLVNEQRTINKLTVKGRMTATDKERQTEIMFDLSAINSSLSKAERTLDNVKAQITKRRTVDLNVLHMVHPNVAIILDGMRYKVQDGLRGPVRFMMNGKNFVYRQGDAPALPINKITDASPVRNARPAA